MRAAVLRNPALAADRPLDVGEVERPVAGELDIVIDVQACAMCRTDLQICEGELAARRLPLIPGHQVVGVVSAIGSEVRDLRVGDRVGVAWIARTCGRCRFCASGRENLCVDASFTGWDVDGGFAQSMRAHHDFVYRLPARADAAALAPLLCGGVIGFRSLRVAGVQPGMRVGLFGFGASATSVLQVARHWGCEVYVVTRSAVDQQRARELGATWAGAYTTPVPVMLDAAITFAPSGDVVVAALAATDRGGVVAINAIHLDRIPEFDYDLLWWERSVRSVANVTRQDVIDFLDLAIRIPLRTQFDRYPLERANDALLDVARGRVTGAAVLEPPIAPR
jgi:propanol-preferring alcohol dehydrogenase